MTKTEKIIKQYEPLMHKLLQTVHTGADYQDYMQELRLTAWQVLQKFDEKRNTKLETLMYNTFKNKINDLLRKSGKIMRKNPCHKCKLSTICIEECPTKSNALLKFFRKLMVKNPTNYEDLSWHNKNRCLMTGKARDNIHYHILIDVIEQKLSNIDKLIFQYKLAGDNQSIIATKLHITQQRVAQRLKNIRNMIKSTIERGE